MCELLDQLGDDEMDFTVKITDTDGKSGAYEFLDMVSLDEVQYAVVSPLDADGYVDIFRIQTLGGKELYIREKNDSVLEKVFAMFKLKNEDEFDFA